MPRRNRRRSNRTGRRNRKGTSSLVSPNSWTFFVEPGRAFINPGTDQVYQPGDNTIPHGRPWRLARIECWLCVEPIFGESGQTLTATSCVAEVKIFNPVLNNTAVYVATATSGPILVGTVPRKVVLRNPDRMWNPNDAALRKHATYGFTNECVMKTSVAGLVVVYHVIYQVRQEIEVPACPTLTRPLAVLSRPWPEDAADSLSSSVAELKLE